MAAITILNTLKTPFSVTAQAVAKKFCAMMLGPNLNPTGT